MNPNTLARVFHERAKRLRNLAFVLLGIIVLLLGAGVLVFVWAARITHQDAAALSASADLDKEFVAQRATLTSALNKIAQDLQDIIKRDLRDSRLEADKPKLLDVMSNIASMAVKAASSNEFDFQDNPLQSKFEEASKQVLNSNFSGIVASGFMVPASDALAAVRAAATNYVATLKKGQESTDDGFYFFVATQITRFGTLLIVVFLVGILVNLYRYNVRLSAYYDGRGDTVTMLGLKADEQMPVDTFAKLVKEMSPEAYDFGKMPRSPADQAVDIAKEVIAKIPTP
jgi:hypothetical protein